MRKSLDREIVYLGHTALYSMTEAGEFLGIAQNTLRKYCRLLNIPRRRIRGGGRYRYIRYDDLMKILELLAPPAELYSRYIRERIRRQAQKKQEIGE